MPSPLPSETLDTQPATSRRVYDARPDPHLLDFLNLIIRARWALLILTVVGAVGMFWLTYKMPQLYEAQATILPPDKNSSIGLLDRFKSAGTALKMLKAVENPSVDLLQNILESEFVDARIAQDSECAAYYRKYVVPRHEFATTGEWMHSVARVDPRISKLFVIADVETGWFADASENDAAKRLAGRIPMLAIREMNRFIADELQSTSRVSRQNAEELYALRKAELDSTASVLEAFQSENRVAALPKQIAGLIQSSAALRAQLVQNEMKRSLAETELTPSSAQMVELQRRIQALTATLSEDRAATAIGPGYNQLPRVQQRLASLELQIATLEPIVQFLRMEIEQERINETRDHTAVQVLDPAVAPNRKTAPKRLPFLLLGLTAGSAMIAAYVLGTQLWRNLKADVALRSVTEEFG